jgi:hypothetical protein
MKLYLGPYVSVKVPVKKLLEKELWCLNCDIRRGDTKFCSNCGNPVSFKERIVNTPYPHWTVPATVVLRCITTEGRNIDSFVHYIYTIGNGRTDFNERQEDETRLNKYWYGRYGSYDGATDLHKVKPEEEIKFLQSRCCLEIEKLEEVFGKENIGFGWGVVGARR